MKSFEKFFKAVDPTIKYDPAELKLGIEIEKEHTENEAIATTIAKQHLAEDPHYYTKLKKVEKH